MQIKAVIDRFEGEKAVLLTGEEEVAVNWPRTLLPDAVEGDILQFTVAVDVAATRLAREEAEALLALVRGQRASSD